MKLIPLAITALLISGCQPSQSSGQNLASTPTQIPVAEKKTTIDLSTPDRALKSYWQELDAFVKLQNDINNKESTKWDKINQDLSVDYKKTLGGDVLTVFTEKNRPDVSTIRSREIISIKQETESRTIAIAITKNITPIPSTVSLNEAEVTRRNKGTRLKYLLEKEADGWKVTQIYSEGYKEDEWNKEHSPSQASDANIDYI
jgi:hypothetical protein